MKSYNNEKAIISITSHKRRINTVAKTIFSLLTYCKDFHIVLVLSTDEFIKKDDDLPEDLRIILKNDLIELLWVKENTKAFKKVLPTMEKYPDIPIITADDGCYYYRNYADDLYNRWLSQKNSIISYNRFCRLNIVFGGGGSGIIFPPGCFKGFKPSQKIIDTGHDDYYYGCLAKIMHIDWIFINRVAKDSNFKNLTREPGVSSRFRHNENSICAIIKKELNL